MMGEKKLWFLTCDGLGCENTGPERETIDEANEAAESEGWNVALDICPDCLAQAATAGTCYLCGGEEGKHKMSCNHG